MQSDQVFIFHSILDLNVHNKQENEILIFNISCQVGFPLQNDKDGDDDSFSLLIVLIFVSVILFSLTGKSFSSLYPSSSSHLQVNHSAIKGVFTKIKDLVASLFFPRFFYSLQCVQCFLLHSLQFSLFSVFNCVLYSLFSVFHFVLFSLVCSVYLIVFFIVQCVQCF